MGNPIHDDLAYDDQTGRYRVHELLGTGGCAEAFVAYDRIRQRKVALKRLLANAGRLRTSLFEREFHALAQLAHPRIIEVYDYGVDAQGPFYTMELLGRLDLGDGSGLPWLTVCAHMRDLASSLALIHARRLLHRDVTPRNLCRADDGRVKLIDFGALTPMGKPRDVVGTAPFVPPEAVHRHELDARADLYGLGATAYYLLTGRHAYPARTLAELSDAWRSPPPMPHALVSSIPRELSELVMSLLSLDRRGRPAYATEVTERLNALAQLEPEPYEIGRAYLTTPTLVGREQQLSRVRRDLLAHRQGHPGTLLVTGPSAIGRTRFLDHCALEAKLLGAKVLQHAAEEGCEDYAGITQLAEDLIALAPGTRDAARTEAEILAHVVPSLRTPTFSHEETARRTELRPLIHRALSDWLLRVSQELRLVLVVDDVHVLDEPSAAILAGLALRAKEGRLQIIASAVPDASGTQSPRVEALAGVAEPLQLEALERDQTHELVRATFGDVPNVHTLAEHLYSLCRGNPGVCLKLARHLVDEGVTRFERGTWLVPERLEAVALPASFEDALRRALTALSPPALELLRGLALCAEPVGLPECRELVADVGSSDRVFDALHELQSRDLVVVSRDAYVPAHGLAAVVAAHSDAASLRRTHARLARILHARGAHPANVFHHELRGGLEGAGLDRLLDMAAAQAEGRIKPDDILVPTLPDDAELALELCHKLARPPLQHFKVAQFITLLSYYVEPTLALRHGPVVETHLRTQLGFIYWSELPADTTEQDRVLHGLRRAQEVHDRLPDHERTLSPLEALHALGRYAMVTVSPYALMLELEALKRLEALLSPLEHLSPQLALILLLVRASDALDSGRDEQAAAFYQRALDLLASQDAIVSPELKRSLRHGILMGLAHVRAQYADPILLEWANELESSPNHEANAWRLRRFFHMFSGDIRETRRCTGWVERSSLQNRSVRTSDGGTVFMDMQAARLSRDLSLFSEVLERVEAVADRFPNQTPTRHYARGAYEALRGNHACAKTHLELTLSLIAPSHTVWACAAQDYGEALIATGELSRAHEHLTQAIAIAQRHEIAATKQGVLEQLLARCEVELGSVDEGLRRMHDAVAACERRGESPIARGGAYERAARTALVAGNRQAFEHYAAKLKRICMASRNPSLTACYNALAGTSLSGLSLSPAATAHGDQPRADLSEALTMLSECHDPPERARLALNLLTEHCEATVGVLYRVVDGTLSLAAASEQEPAGLRAAALRCCLWATQTDAAVTEAATQATEDIGPLVGDGYRPILLAWNDGEQSCVSGVAMIRSGSSRLVSAELITSVGRALADLPSEVPMDSPDGVGVDLAD